MSLAIVQSGQIVLSRGFGFSDLERRIAASDSTPYNIASVTKPIAAVVAMRLVELGKLDLDRRMTSFAGFAEFCDEAHAGGGMFFGTFDCAAPALTLRRVMSMTSNGAPGTRFFYTRRPTPGPPVPWPKWAANRSPHWWHSTCSSPPG